MTADEILDELSFLATVEHALLVEYLSVYAALGQDVDAATTGASERVQFAAGEADTLSRVEMTNVHRINEALVEAGRPPQLGRATSIRDASGAELSLRPPTKAELEHLLDRERAIASAVDGPYARLRAALPPKEDGGPVGALGPLVEALTGHASALDPLAERLHDVPASEFLRVSGREPATPLQRKLLALSDQVYASLVGMVDVWFTHDDELLGQLWSPAISAMTALNGVNAELVKRGLLPAYSPAA